MNRQRYQDICDMASTGEARYVQNRDSLYTGEVIGCMELSFKVEVFGHQTDWPMEACEPADGKGNPLGPPSNI